MLAAWEPADWAKSAEKALAVLWDSVDAADLAVTSALREQDPVNTNLQRFSSEFSAVRRKRCEVLLDALSPETSTDEPAGEAGKEGSDAQSH